MVIFDYVQYWKRGGEGGQKTPNLDYVIHGWSPTIMHDVTGKAALLTVLTV